MPHVDAEPRRLGPKLVSVVVPAYNEAGNIAALHDRVRQALQGHDWELVIVDDGSADATFEHILACAKADERVRGIGLSRNFGHQYALLAGLKASRGDVVVSMDADLQHPPETIPRLIEAWRQGCNIVHTRRLDAGELTWFKRRTSALYYRLFSLLCGVEIEEGMSDFRLLDRRVVEALTSMEEADLFLRGLVRWVGYRHTTVEYPVAERQWGRSKYGLGRMLAFAGSGITAFSTLPLRIGIAVGFLTAGFAGLELVYVIGVALSGESVPGWASVVGLVTLLFGVSFILLGFLGIYVGHIFERVQRHPAYLVERTTEEYLGAPRPAARGHGGVHGC